MIYPESLENKIGFDGVRNIIAEHCGNKLGKDKCRGMKFSSNYVEIKSQLLQTNEFLCILNSNEDFPNGNIHDLQAELKRIKTAGTYLTESELYRLGQTLASAIEIHSFFTEERKARYPELWKIGITLSLFPEIVELISRTVDKYGEIKDNASPELLRIRRELSATMGSISRSLNNILRTAQSEGVVDKDVAPTMRDGRLVIPVAPSLKRKIKGRFYNKKISGFFC